MILNNPALLTVIGALILCENSLFAKEVPCSLSRSEMDTLLSQEVDPKLKPESSQSKALHDAVFQVMQDGKDQEPMKIYKHFIDETYGKGASEKDNPQVKWVGPFTEDEFLNKDDNELYGYRTVFKNKFRQSLENLRSKPPLSNAFSQYKDENHFATIDVTVPNITASDDCNQRLSDEDTKRVIAGKSEPIYASDFLKKCAEAQSPALRVCVVRKNLKVTRNGQDYFFKNIPSCASYKLLGEDDGEAKTLSVQESLGNHKAVCTTLAKPLVAKQSTQETVPDSGSKSKPKGSKPSR